MGVVAVVVAVVVAMVADTRVYIDFHGKGIAQ